MSEPPQVAGAVALAEVLRQLSARRAVFHSKADLQFSFARTLWQLAPSVETRLEVPVTGTDRRRRYLDLLCRGPKTTTAIELKYFTRRWIGESGDAAEQFALRSHAATDLLRLHYLRDVARLEAHTAVSSTEGLAILLTNEPGLWTEPRNGRVTRDQQFRLHQGRHLSGTLSWAGGTCPANDLTLTKRYTLDWHDYSEPDGSSRLRYLALRIPAANEATDDSGDACPA